MQKTANETAAGLRRICKISAQPKIEEIENNDERLILRRKRNGTATCMIESKLKAKNFNRAQLFRPVGVISRSHFCCTCNEQSDGMEDSFWRQE